jgi:hypothetical protein
MAITSEDDFLRRVVGPDLSARGFDVRYEMTFLLPTLDGGCQQRRADLYITAPPRWEHAGRWPAIAVEGKRRDGGSMGEEIDGLLQTRSCLYGYRFRIGSTDYPRPSLALYVDQQFIKTIKLRFVGIWVSLNLSIYISDNVFFSRTHVFFSLNVCSIALKLAHGSSRCSICRSCSSSSVSPTHSCCA